MIYMEYIFVRRIYIYIYIYNDARFIECTVKSVPVVSPCLRPFGLQADSVLWSAGVRCRVYFVLNCYGASFCVHSVRASCKNGLYT